MPSLLISLFLLSVCLPLRGLSLSSEFSFKLNFLENVKPCFINLDKWQSMNSEHLILKYNYVSASNCSELKILYIAWSAHQWKSLPPPSLPPACVYSSKKQVFIESQSLSKSWECRSEPNQLFNINGKM